MKDIKTDRVDSSAIAEIGYDPDKEILRVIFPSGAVWDYANVSKQRYDALMGAASIGKYFSKEIRGTYSGTRVD